MSRINLIRLLLLVGLFLASCGQHEYHGMLFDPANPAPDFTIIDQQQQPFQLSKQHGKVVVIFFGFTHCPDVCPTTLADLKAVRNQLGNDAGKLQVVFISVDPERDTPELTSRYAQGFDPSFIGLSSPQTTLDPILQAYGVTAIRRDLPGSALGYTMDHSTYTYVIDAAGRYRLLFSHDATISDMTSDLRYLIAQGAS